MGKNSYAILLGSGIVTCLLFCGAMILVLRQRTISSWFQLIGAGCLMFVVLTHVAEALNLFPWMYWGLPHSIGHYADFGSAVLGLTLFSLGYFLHAFSVLRHRM